MMECFLIKELPLNIYDFEEQEMVNQINNALKSKNKKNDLTNKFSYEKMATKLLENIL